MSSLFGIYNRNGQPISPRIASDMHESTSYWGPDESGLWTEDAVVLGHEMLWNTPESKDDHLPFEQERFVITMDARLDNRGVLAKQLEMKCRPLEQITDSELILAAFCKWGEECPEYLIGDFVFAIWDKLKRKLFCARDHLGVKPFYYHLNDSLFVFGNDLKGIISHPDISTAFCDEAVANYLTHTMLLHTSLTFFKDIQKLPAAHSLTVSAKSIEKERYWRSEDSPVVKLPSFDAYVIKLRELIEQAVHDRLRSAYPIASHLSGGLDSSIVSVIAARKLRKQDKKLQAYNWLHEPATAEERSHFEWANSIELAESEGFDLSFVPITTDDIIEYLENHNISYGDSSGFLIEYPVRKIVQQKGARTILSGWGGDDFSTYHGKSYLASLARTGNLKQIIKTIRKRVEGKRRKLRLSIKILYHGIFLSFIPRRFYNRMPKKQTYAFLPFRFCAQDFWPIFNREQTKLKLLSPQVQPTIKDHMLSSIANNHLAARMESWAAAAFVNRLEYSFPLLDKRIVEFMLGVPAQYFVRDGIGRYLIRSAMSGTIPDKILWADKAIERNRIEKFLALAFDAHKMRLRNLKEGKTSSAYIDIAKLQETMAQAKQDEEWLSLCLESGSALAVLQCEKK